MSQKATDAKKLTAKQRSAVRALVTTPDVTTAAATAGVARQTVHRWLSEPHFVAALDEAEREALKLFTRELVGMSALAVAAIRDALQDESISIRLRAADVFTQRMLQFRELVVLEQRVAALEESRNE